VSIGGKPKSATCEALAAEYLQRSVRYSPIESQSLASEEKFLGWCGALHKKGAVRVVLFDSVGSLVTSEALADLVGEAGVAGTQHLVFAIGGADGWSREALQAADQKISFGRITLPHELARAVAAEQLYRALTILAGHPYHSGH
jgi:23S rRNA (pseudouridine1915-N3)-methyltransferase